MGWYHGWEEALGYHQSFRDKEISGIQLPELTVEFLKFKLGIANERHQLIIMSTIRKLFPNTTVKDPEYLSPYSYVSLELVPSVNHSYYDGTKSMKPDSLSQISNHKLDGSDTMSISCSSRESIKTNNQYDMGSDNIQKEHQVEDDVERKLKSCGNDPQFCKSPIRKTEMSISDPLAAEEPH